MNRWWLALAEQAPAARAEALVRDEDGAAVGTLAAWERQGKPLRNALRVDGRVIDAEGAPAWVSLVLAPERMRVPFDDLVVQHARREVLARAPAEAVSTLLRDNSTFAGAITVARGPDARHTLHRDPFARIFSARILHVEGGLLGRVPAPVGPSIERYGSDNPWPWERFELDARFSA